MATFPYAAEFPVEPAIIYLNHAGVGPWPQRTLAAISAFAQENVRCGAARYPEWMAVEAALKTRLARFINATGPDDIALLKNTSEGLSMVAGGLPWRAGDNVVLAAHEFPSNRIPWEALAARGVAVRIASLDGEDPEAELIAQLDERTRVLAVSAVQYATGLRMDLARLGAAARANGSLFCVDAIQQLGALRFDMQAVQADVVVADAHKWLLAPEGTALFCTSARARGLIAPTQFGWHMVEHAGDFNRSDWQPAHSARRYECGSSNMLGIHALSASLSFFEEAGMEDIERRVLAHAGFLADAIGELPGWSLLSRREQPRFHSGIVTFRHASGEHASLAKRLREQGVVCIERGGGIRLSPHAWLDQGQLECAVGLISRVSAD
jgi:cysteine desulfurase/selenocysteine lyase